MGNNRQVKTRNRSWRVRMQKFFSRATSDLREGLQDNTFNTVHFIGRLNEDFGRRLHLVNVRILVVASALTVLYVAVAAVIYWMHSAS